MTNKQIEVAKVRALKNIQGIQSEFCWQKHLYDDERNWPFFRALEDTLDELANANAFDELEMDITQEATRPKRKFGEKVYSKFAPKNRVDLKGFKSRALKDMDMLAKAYLAQKDSYERDAKLFKALRNALVELYQTANEEFADIW